MTKPSRDDYARAFDAERVEIYPAVSAFEVGAGFLLDRRRLEAAARVLACPVRAHAPNWQHGRVLYAMARQYLAGRSGPCQCLDIGTAKGFSALVLRWALDDAGVAGEVLSVDVLDPLEKVRRNTVAEVDGYLTLAETLAPWPEAARITFQSLTGVAALKTLDRVHIAFVDGKHTFEAVSKEVALLAERQQPGDVVMFDDAQVDGVAMAAKGSKQYDLTEFTLLPHRSYLIGFRRG